MRYLGRMKLGVPVENINCLKIYRNFIKESKINLVAPVEEIAADGH